MYFYLNLILFLNILFFFFMFDFAKITKIADNEAFKSYFL